MPGVAEVFLADAIFRTGERATKAGGARVAAAHTALLRIAPYDPSYSRDSVPAIGAGIPPSPNGQSRKPSDAEVPSSTCSVFSRRQGRQVRGQESLKRWVSSWAGTQQTRALTLDPTEALRYE